MSVLEEAITRTIRSVLTDDHKVGMYDGCIISEASLGRVISHYRNGRFFIITANRASEGNRHSAGNRQANSRLLSDLNKMKLGPQTLIGHWQECQDDSISYEDCPIDMLIDVEEYSFFVPVPEEMSDSDAENLVASLTKKYNQDASVYGDQGGLHIVYRNGSKSKFASGVTINKIAQGYSQIARGKYAKRGEKGKKTATIPFVFEGVLVPVTNHGKMIFESKGLTYPRLGDLELMVCPTVAERFGRL